MENNKGQEPGGGIRKARAPALRYDHRQYSDAKNVCTRCGKTVYLVELCRVNGEPYHKTCFTCKECNSLLSTVSYNTHGGELYCAHHLKEIVRGSGARLGSSSGDASASQNDKKAPSSPDPTILKPKESPEQLTPGSADGHSDVRSDDDDLTRALHEQATISQTDEKHASESNSTESGVTHEKKDTPSTEVDPEETETDNTEKNDWV